MEASVSLYELNRSIIKQQGPLEEKDIKSKMNMLKEFSNTFEKYSLLYGKEINYFTLFVKDENWELESLDLGVIECLFNIGTIYSIEYTKEKDAIEIWVEVEINPDTEKSEKLLTCMYLFPYDAGIVKVGF